MNEFKILHLDDSFVVCLKPARVLSTDEPGGMPELVRRALGDEKACVRTVHRLDRVVSGLMVLARTPQAASELSRQIREDEFAQGEEYGVRKGVEQGVKQGVKQGRTLATAENTLEFLEDLGPVDDSLKDLIQSQTDLTLLKKWHKLAARADSIEAFKEQIQAK